MNFMNTNRRCCFLVATMLACGWLWAQPQPTPLVHVHAHNDYAHKRPLFDALDHGFCSVEADIHLVDGHLLVAHDRTRVKPGRTLESLYLDPLRERVMKNGGRVYAGGPECVLLIDIKGRWQETYPVLREVLKRYGDMLSTFSEGKRETRAILVIITGDRSKQMFDGETVRYAAYDGELGDLESSESPDLIPWISSNWTQSFKWRGAGAFPEEERARLQDIVAKAHAHHRRVRFWGSPDQPVFWQEMLNAGVDLINTDDLAGAQSFLLQHNHK
jgi:glycerophosphoryl diester phosphodiesterase